jgi:hypothetical protein
MGWGSAGRIFDPVAKRLIQGVLDEEVAEYVAVETLAALAQVLRDNDWDTEDASLEASGYHRIVESALSAAGWVPRSDD